MNTSLQAKITAICEQIHRFETMYGRARGSVRLIAVSKTRPASLLQEAYQCGQKDFGENYLQESLQKQQLLSHLPLVWHFIGPIQSNKTRDIAAHFDWVHSLDRLKTARRLSEQRPEAMPDLPVLIQVNLGREPGKSGVSPEELPELAAAVDTLPRISLRGLMAIPAPETDFALQRATFRQLREARDLLVSKGLEKCRELSMGMSADYQAAIAEGATMVRIGTELFGPRD